MPFYQLDQRIRIDLLLLQGYTIPVVLIIHLGCILVYSLVLVCVFIKLVESVYDLVLILYIDLWPALSLVRER